MAEPSTTQSLLSLRGLKVGFRSDQTDLVAVDNLDLDIAPGKTLGLVGESGCGKSVTALAALRLLPKPAGRILAGEAWFEGKDLFKAPIDAMYDVRGKRIAMIFQEPMSSLNPVMRIGDQITEMFLRHRPQMSAQERSDEAVRLLTRVGIPLARERLKSFPHELSGGLRQRVMIAMALSLNPRLLIADEPTTALDVTIQAQVLHLIKDIQRETKMAVLLITHDLGVVAEVCDEVAVMYAGQLVERADVFELFDNPLHPYTRGLLRSLPTLETPPRSYLPTIKGQVPQLHEIGAGCRFANRCTMAEAACRAATPELEVKGKDQHTVRCIKV